MFTDRNTRDHLAWTIDKRGSHARGVHPTHDTSRIGTAGVKEEEETDTRICESSRKSGRKEREHEGEKSQIRPS